MQHQTDLFGDAPRISLPDNPLLATIANHILDLTQRDPSLLDGDSVGQIDRKLVLAMWFDEGLKHFIPEDKRDAFIKWFEKCPDEEAVSRARRLLADRDLIRLPTKAVVAAEHHRQRIARSVKQ